MVGPAINAGNNAGAPEYDQRGIGFARIKGGTIDIGAYESNFVPPQPPVIALSSNPLAYTENDLAKAIDSTATVTDADSPNFGNGKLTVKFDTNGAAGEDVLAIGKPDSYTDQISVTGSNITYKGTTIGTFTGGSDGSTPLVISFNSSATPEAAQALLRNITYNNTSDNPSTGSRTVSFVLDDGNGGTSTAATKTINVTPVDNAPSVTLPGEPINYTENAAPTAINSTATVTDVDSTNFNGGNLTVNFTQNGSAADVLGIASQNTAGITVSNNSISYNGKTIGTFAGGSNNDSLVINFNSDDASPEAAQALLQNITYSNSSDNPSAAPRTVSFVLDDGDGGTSTAATKTINLIAPVLNQVQRDQLLQTGQNESGNFKALVFDEDYYLKQNPDVAQAVKDGVVSSGFDHFERYGEAEGRNPCSLFDNSRYLADNPDVAQAVKDGVVSSGVDHYLRYGQFEGRQPNLQLFDQSYYLANNPDVAQAVKDGVVKSGCDHYLRYGRAEGRSV